MAPKFFPTSGEWREWLVANHAKETELLVGFYKRDAGRPSMTWSESVDEALCFGWIDGVSRSLDKWSYTKRYSVRKAGSIWSKVNIAKAEALIAQGRMTAAGLAKFRARSAARSGIYAFEQGVLELDENSAVALKQTPGAWEFLQSQAASYRQKVIWWIATAKQASTRQKRLAKLIEASANRQRVHAFAENR